LNIAAVLQFMTSGPSTVLLLHRFHAVAAWRALIGPTNSAVARSSAPHSLRAEYGTDGEENALHGSDSAASAAREAAFSSPPSRLPVLPPRTQRCGMCTT
jgi:nucleoside-diphosphate kinase